MCASHYRSCSPSRLKCRQRHSCALCCIGYLGLCVLQPMLHAGSMFWLLQQLWHQATKTTDAFHHSDTRESRTNQVQSVTTSSARLGNNKLTGLAVSQVSTTNTNTTQDCGIMVWWLLKALCADTEQEYARTCKTQQRNKVCEYSIATDQTENGHRMCNAPAVLSVQHVRCASLCCAMLRMTFTLSS